MANVRVTWTLPTVRKSGKPLNPADVKHVEVQMSADDGANYAQIGLVPPATLELTQTELEPGRWLFRARCVDTADRAGDFVTGEITIADETAPGLLESFTVALA